MTGLKSVSVTEQLDFDACKRYWLWSNYPPELESGWYVSKSPQMPLWLGGGLHRGLEAYFRQGRSTEWALGVYDQWYTEFTKRTQDDFLWIWDSLSMELQKMYELGRGMLINYDIFERSGQSILRGEIEHVEKKIKLPILNPQSRKPTSTLLVGKLDLTLRDGHDVWVVDHKSASSKPQAGGIDVDEQLTAYCYMYWREYGEVPAGAIYNVMLKSLPEPPYQLKPTKTEPIIFSRAKSQSTVYEVYLQTLIDNGIDPKGYAEVLSNLKLKGWSDYFVQQEVTRNEDELIAYEKRLYYRSQQMARAKARPGTHAFPTPTTRGCGFCPFLDPCKAKDRGDDYISLLETMFTVRGGTDVPNASAPTGPSASLEA